MKVIFFGTPAFAANVFTYLKEHGVDIVAVVSKPDKMKGRSGTPTPPPVVEAAKSFNIPIYQPEQASSAEFAPILAKFNADIFAVVAYGEIIKQHLLDMPQLGCINVHASLLPKYRGAAPIHRCIIDGEAESGVTIMHMVKKMDAGDIIKTVRVPIGRDMTAGELEKALCDAGSKALLEVIHDFDNGIITSIPQDHAHATYAPKIELEECQVDWSKPAAEVHNLIRGTTPFPGPWCLVDFQGHKKRVKLARSSLVEGLSDTPGKILSCDKDGLIVACGSGAVRLGKLQMEGKKMVDASDFLSGYPIENF